MTNPNLVNTGQVFMRSNIQIPIASLTDILENSSASNMIIRADVVTICNTTATAADIDVYLTRSSVNYAIAKTIAVPAYSSMFVLDKDYPIYLEEGDKIQVLGGPGLQAICSYTIISDTSITLPDRPVINVINVITFIGSATNFSTDNTSTLTAPSDIEAGDILIFTDFVPNYTSGTVPSGFTNIILTEVVGVDHRTSYKIADGTEGGTTITGMTGSDFACALLVFRPSFSTSVSFVTWNSQGAEGDTSSQTVTPPTDKPVLVLFIAGSRNGVPILASESPLFDSTISVGTSSESLLIGYSVYINGASSHTADVTSAGTRNTFHSGYLQLLA